MELNIREVREASGLTQAELAKKSGIDRAAICQLETGRRSHPNIRTLEKLADALDAKLIIKLERRRSK